MYIKQAVQSGGYEKTKHAKFSAKQTTLTILRNVSFSEKLACFVFL